MGFVVKLVLALAVVAALVWGYVAFFMKPAPAPVQETAQQAQEEPVTQTPAPAAPDDGGISASGSTDASLNGDLRALDTQVDSAQRASADADASATDRPIEQTE